MKTLSSIQFKDKKDDFSGIKFILKISILFAAVLLLMTALNIPTF